MRSLLPVLALGLSCLLGGPRPSAAEPAPFTALQWRLIGPFRGGRVLAVGGVPGEPDHFYFGSVNGGVWETNDSGRTWHPTFDSQPIGSIGALAIAKADPKVIYVGTGEADMRSDIAQGDGVYKTTDGGRHWLHVGLRDTQQIGRILVDPRDAQRVFVAALGHPYGPNAERGVFRSKDGGASWRKVLFKDDDTGAIDLAFEPGNPDVVYAALWQTRRPPWNVYPPSNGPGSGLYKSIDGGTSWVQIVGHGFPADPGRIGLALAPSRPGRVYAAIDGASGGVFRSDDAGASWTRTTDDRRIRGRGWYFGGLTVEPRDPDVVYACNTALYRSSDAGRTFQPIKGAPGGDDYHELWIDPERPQRRILGVDQGTVVSQNGGETWSSWYNQPTAQMYHVTTDDRFPYWVYGSQQDSGAAALPSRTGTRDGISLMQFHELTAGGESDEIAPDPRDPDRIYGGRVDVLDQRTGQTHSVDPTLAHREVTRETWTLPLVFSRRDPSVLYFAREKLFRTDNGGRHWSVISPDLTRPAPGIPKTLDPATAADVATMGPRGVIYAIAPSRLADHDVWVGTDDGKVWRTRDEGAHWDDITPAALTAWSKVGIIDTSHFDAETAYLAVDRHRLEDTRPYVYRTHDGGRSWTPCASGIPDGSFVNAVREDPVRRGLLYAGTEKGVYVSLDDGDHWQPLQLTLPVTSVRDIDVHGNDVVIATHGRGFWILDDVTPLRQWDAKVAQAPAWLFAPANAVRVRPSVFTGTPMPQDEALARDPPAGAVIDYALHAPVVGPLVLSILDAKGELVRRWTSDDPTPAHDPAKSHIAPEWTEPASVPGTATGMHRFVWSLRRAQAPALVETDTPPDGIWMPPGSYTVELRVGDTRLTQPLHVRPDPRVTLAPAAYARQFALASALELHRVRIATVLDEAAALRKKLLEQGLSALAADVFALAGPGFGEAPVGRPPLGTSTLRSVSGSLDHLAVAVDGADVAPTPDAEAGILAIEPVETQTLAAWHALQQQAAAALAHRGSGSGSSAD